MSGTFSCDHNSETDEDRFGGGSDLLGGTDKTTWWKTQEASNAYVAPHHLNASPEQHNINCIVLSSPGTFFSHLTWLGAYLRPLPPFSRPINAHLANCHARTRQRLQRDSETRDLFYYLVRLVPVSPLCTG